MGVTSTDLTRFSWTQNKHLSFHIVKTHTLLKISHTRSYLLFISKSLNDNLKYKDLSAKTHNFEFEQLGTANDKLTYLINNNLITIDASEIIANHTTTIPLQEDSSEKSLSIRLSSYVKNLATSEYITSKKSLEQRGIIERFPFSNKQIFVDTYHFDKMLKVINNDQFSDEFNQCLFAYENEKWFICAAGLGSCIEHLMLLTLTNYHKEKNLNGRNPTAKDYLRAFTKEPINLESRQQTYIDTLFGLRNSVDHHNSGYTSKRICDLLLDGVSDIFNEYYVPSLSNTKK